MTIFTNILVVNPGSSSLKWSWFSSSEIQSPEESGSVDAENFKDDLTRLVNRLTVSMAIIRFVHGGGKFSSPVKVSSSNIKKFATLDEFAPLHNPGSLFCTELVYEAMPSSTDVYAVFDSDFFSQLPLVSQSYALPRSLINKYPIRRFGFHGFAHSAMYSHWLSKQSLDQKKSAKGIRIVTIQLGSGCSMAAILNGKPIDTSMGFTPNEGLIMATRCGDIDPGLITWLQRKEKWGPAETDRVLNLESGWLGLSSNSSNFADLLISEEEQSRLAVNLMCWRVKKSLGAYFAILGGLDAVLISGGLAENASNFCRHLLSELKHLGIQIQPQINKNENLIDRMISTNSSAVACWIVANRESQAMLDSVVRYLNNKKT